MLITVIVISKDDLGGLKNTLRSIGRQRVNPDELIVVTKGASDNIKFEDYSFSSSVCHVIQPDSGISAAFNLALSLSNGKWVNFLNGGDVYAHSEVLALWRSSLHDNIEIIAGRAYDQSTENLIPRDLYFRAQRVDQISHQASLFRRNLFECYGNYSLDFRIRMDFEWMLRLNGDVRIFWLDEVLVDFEGGGASSIYPIRSSLEEYEALSRRNYSFLKRIRLLLMVLPYRVVRDLVRKSVVRSS
jgi:glycosyltransferase involved in cell wall biosynthesis